MTPQSLNLAKPGSILRVVEIAAKHDDAIRLKRMGICEGRMVQLVQAGDPLIVGVVGCRIGVSRRLAAQIHVEPCNECPSETRDIAKKQ